MSLEEALAPQVPARTRTKGNRYFLGGAVREIEGSDWHVDATVRGSTLYDVQLVRSAGELLFSCECPFFTDRLLTCKHVWAVILAADAAGHLRGDGSSDEPLYLEASLLPLDSETLPPRVAYRPDRGGAPPVPEPWRLFLQRVEQRARPANLRAGRLASGEILYVVQADESTALPVPTVHVYVRTRKKNGEWARPQPASISLAEVEQVQDPDDREILARLIGVADPYTYPGGPPVSRSAFRLTGPLVGRLLPRLARSGRLYLARTDDPAQGRAARDARGDGSAAGPERSEARPLHTAEGDPWSFRLEVRESGGQIHIGGCLERAGGRMDLRDVQAVLSPAFVAAGGALVPIEARELLPWLLELWQSRRVVLPASAGPALMASLARSGVEPDRLPDSLRYEAVSVPPVPRIRMSRLRRAFAASGDLEATVSFDYAGSVFPPGSERTGYDGERGRMVRRSPAAEQAAIDRLQQLGVRRPWTFGGSESALSVPVERFPLVVRTLVNEGWHVEAEGRVIRAPRGMRMQVRSGVDWFELHGEVDFGEGRSASIAALLAALRRGDATLVLDDGTRGMIPEAWLKQYARMAAFGQPGEDHIRYSRSQSVLLDALLESQPAVSVDETFARARAQLAAFDRIQPMDPPATFTGSLRDYQRDALGWFHFLRQFGFGGCLADDMGLGKTVMVLALLESRRVARERGAPRVSIAVVPRSLVFNWKQEAAAFTPRLRVLDYTGEGRDTISLDGCDLVLTTYGTLRRDAARLADQEFDYVILDEAQAIKNQATAAAKAARLLRARHRLALSGTPIENHVGELWSLFEFLNPGFLGASAAFGRTIAAQRRDGLDLTLLARALKPFILRRTKEQVAPELPARTEQTIHCDLEPAERRLYDDLRAHYRRTLLARIARSGLSRSTLQVLEALLRLRQAALHPGLVDPRRAGESSSKLELLLTRLREVIDEGHKALVFSQFTSLLGLLRARLDARQIVYEYLDGQTRDRAERVARFESDPACPVFLISLKAGGLGLNLTAADYVFLLDPWWNPAVEAQAIDRTHRIGQSRQVFAYRLIARDTVEEKIAELQQSKRELAEAILGEEAGAIGSLRPEDLDWLLS